MAVTKTNAGTMKQAPATSRPGHPPALVPDVDGHLRGVRAGDEVGGAEQVEGPLSAHPAATPDDLVLHHGDVRGGPSERGRAQPEEEPCQLSHAGGLGKIGRAHV